MIQIIPFTASDASAGGGNSLLLLDTGPWTWSAEAFGNDTPEDALPLGPSGEYG